MSGSTTPVSSVNSYSDADVRAQSVWQAEVHKLKVAQLDELLSKKGVKPKGLKAEKAMEVAWRYTKEEIAEWRAQQEELARLQDRIGAQRAGMSGRAASAGSCS